MDFNAVIYGIFTTMYRKFKRIVFSGEIVHYGSTNGSTTVKRLVYKNKNNIFRACEFIVVSSLRFYKCIWLIKYDLCTLEVRSIHFTMFRITKDG